MPLSFWNDIYKKKKVVTYFRYFMVAKSWLGEESLNIGD